MWMLRMRISRSARVAVLALAACSGDDDSSPDVSPKPDAGEEEAPPCGPTYPDVSEGLTARAGDLTVKLLSADLKPARQFVKNDWVLQVLDGADAPVEDFEVADAVSYMAVHNHYGTPDPVVEKLGEPGQFKLDDIRFRMRGPWDVIFQLTHAGKSTMTTFKICVE